MSTNLSPEGFGRSKEGEGKVVADLAQRVLDKLFYPIDNERKRIEEAIRAEFEVIRAKGGWMYYEGYVGYVVDQANEVILKNTNRSPDVSEQLQIIQNLLKQYADNEKKLTNYLALDLHDLLMNALYDEERGVTTQDIEEALKEKGISI